MLIFFFNNLLKISSDTFKYKHTSLQELVTDVSLFCNHLAHTCNYIFFLNATHFFSSICLKIVFILYVIYRQVVLYVRNNVYLTNFLLLTPVTRHMYQPDLFNTVFDKLFLLCYIYLQCLIVLNNVQCMHIKLVCYMCVCYVPSRWN